MEKKTQVSAAEGRQDIQITRDFEIPAELLYKAFSEAEFIEQWMSTNVVKLQNENHGSFRFETKNEQGQVVFSANGTIHQAVPDKLIVRTFEMENSAFGPQLEFLEFEALDNDNSRLKMHIIFRSGEKRDQLLKLPFAAGINMAHNRIEQIFKNREVS